MAIKKSELYSSLWRSCDELRGGMDASQYKDYVLTILFVKYISDKYKGKKFSAIKVPEGASFDDMLALVGKPGIGDDINKKILNPIKEANKLNDFPDFNDEGKLGKGKDLIETVGNLVLIFSSPELDFSGNNANDDDLLGDAYEFLLRHFATESGKSKGQFYTPSEVSRVMAKVIGINKSNASSQTTAYDPACGSGSLLLKLAEEAEKNITLYGQEKDIATANLARMNMILHGNPSAEIWADNTLSRPYWKSDNGEGLKTFDFIVANPPFSLKSWSNGVNTDLEATEKTADKEAFNFSRFVLGVPPEKNGDYAFLLHIIKSLRSTGKAAVVLPHGVLFRGNAEGEIRKNILKKGFIKGILGLPANLFYGTGIPACIIVIDKENAATRKSIFMMDASKGFIKDGNKNRLREQDLRKITDTFIAQTEVAKYSRIVPMSEIADAKNDYNLNIPRYIDTQETEDIQDLTAHLQGGIPARDVEALQKYWSVYPNLKSGLFKKIAKRPGYYQLTVDNAQIKETIFNHAEFKAFNATLDNTYQKWLNQKSKLWEKLDKKSNGKELIAQMSESLLHTFKDNALLEGYDLYQYLLSYWQETMQDDVYAIAIDGWKAGNQWERSIIKGKKGKDGKAAKDKEIAGLAGVEGRLISPRLMIEVFFSALDNKIKTVEQRVEGAQATITDIEEEQTGEEGLFADLEKVNAGEVSKILKERNASLTKAETAVLKNYIEQTEVIKTANAAMRLLQAELENAVIKKYPTLTEAEIKNVLINHKWKAWLQNTLQQEQDKISQGLTQRIQALAERYASTLSSLDTALAEAETKVTTHLQKMNLVW